MINKIKAMLNVAEKWCIIIVPIVYIVIDKLSEFIPVLKDATDEKGYLIVLSGLLVLIFIHFERRDSDTFKIERSNRIVKDLENLLEERKKYNEIYILAVTGYQYFKAFEESEVQVNNLHLLLRRTDKKSTIDLPMEETAKKEFIESSVRMQNEWRKLEEEGKVGKLTIDFYDFDTTMHFMVLDNKELFWGLLYPIADYPGTNVLTQYIVNNKSEVGEKMISDYMKKWNLVNEYSKRGNNKTDESRSQ